MKFFVFFNKLKIRDKPVVEFVSVVVGSYNVQQENVLGFRIESRNAEFHLRKHLPVKIKKCCLVIRPYFR